MTKRYVPDNRVEQAPPLPTDRPATRAEVWEHFHFQFFDIKNHKATPSCTNACRTEQQGELEAFCRDAWAWYYIHKVVFRGWDKQPDWKEGDPVIPEAVPKPDAFEGIWGEMVRVTYECLETARQMSERRAA